MSSCSCDSSLRARRGVSFLRTWRWGTEPLTFKSVSAVVALTPLTLTVTAHGVPDGWSVALLDLGGLDSVNAMLPLSESDYHGAAVVDANTLLFADVDGAVDGQVYTSGGVIAFGTPVDLSTIASVTFNVYALSDATTPVLSAACVLDNAAKTIALAVAPAAITALTDDEYTFNLIATANDGTVFPPLDDGEFFVEDIGSVP